MPRRTVGNVWLAAVALTLLSPRAALADPTLAGHWTSPEHVTFTNPARSGSAFWLDITVAPDGRFTGTWDAYLCTSFPGAYGTMIISCGRAKTPAKAQGKLDLSAGTGEITLEKLGKSAFALQGRADGGTVHELVIDLPEHWLKGQDVILRTSKVARKE